MVDVAPCFGQRNDSHLRLDIPKDSRELTLNDRGLINGISQLFIRLGDYKLNNLSQIYSTDRINT